jgi:cysteine desulfurase
MRQKKQIIYLDNNATTQIDERVLYAMMPFLTNEYANANSSHKFGVCAYEAVKSARTQTANLIGAEPHEIVFTSGATESINLAVKGVAENYQTKGKHIITVKTEHRAVLDTCRYLESKGFEVSYLSVNSEGLIDLDELKTMLRHDTILVSVMMVNNETGIIQPIKEISELVHEVGALLMSDATQAVGKVKVNVDKLGIDLLCLSGHKFYAPKGIGALYVRQRMQRIKIPALLHGGGHEKGFRSGTLNVPGIIGLGEACEIADKEMGSNEKKVGALRNYLEIELLKIKGTKINGNINARLYNTSNILFDGIDSDAIIMALSNPDSNLPLVAVSNGSACTSISIEPSHVLIAMGLSETEAFYSIRFSLGKNNTKEEIDTTIDSVKHVVSTLRSMIS